jgi:hypothetical protein
MGLPTPTRNSLFPAARWSSLGAVPRTLARLGSSSRELDLPFRVRGCNHLPDTSAEHLPWGLAPHSRHQRVKSTRRRASHTRLRSAHSVSRALDGLLLRTPCGLISSHCHVRDSHSRGFVRCQAGLPHRQVVPSCRYRASPHGELPRRCQLHTVRLQGFGPSSDPLQ